MREGKNSWSLSSAINGILQYGDGFVPECLKNLTSLLSVLILGVT